MLKRSDTGKIASAAEIGYSDPINLRKNSEDILILMKVAFSRRLYYHVCHMGHIAVELAMKAVFAKNNAKMHPWGHLLQEICIYECLPNQNLLDDITLDLRIHDHYLMIRTAWNMHDRYQRRVVKQKEAADYKIAYREVTKWIYSKYL